MISKDISNEIKNRSTIIGDVVDEKATEFSLVDNLEDWSIAENDWNVMNLREKLKDLL